MAFSAAVALVMGAVMVWALAIVCISLSCEPVPVVMGWFLDEDECAAAIRAIDKSWRPTMGVYELKCFVRLEV